MSDKWVRDTGLLVVLVFVLLSYFKSQSFFFGAIVSILILMFVPKTFTPVAYIWHCLALFLSKIFGSLFFGLVFFLVVTPIGLLRRAFKKDDLMVVSWKKSGTTFVERPHVFTKVDLERPY